MHFLVFVCLFSFCLQRCRPNSQNDNENHRERERVSFNTKLFILIVWIGKHRRGSLEKMMILLIQIKLFHHNHSERVKRDNSLQLITSLHCVCVYVATFQDNFPAESINFKGLLLNHSPIITAIYINNITFFSFFSCAKKI